MWVGPAGLRGSKFFFGFLLALSPRGAGDEDDPSLMDVLPDLEPDFTRNPLEPVGVDALDALSAVRENPVSIGATLLVLLEGVVDMRKSRRSNVGSVCTLGSLGMYLFRV